MQKPTVFIEKWESELSEWNRVLDSLEQGRTKRMQLKQKKEQLMQ